RVEGNPSTEYHGRVECVTLSKFDELIANNSENYAPILPPYLLSFSYIKKHTFGFNGVGMPESIAFLKSVLHNTIQSHITDQSLPAPLELYNKYKGTLLIHQSPAEDAFNIELWIALLEFLIITSLIDDQQPIDISALEKQASKRKFLFSATEEAWNMLLHKIILSELRGLGTNGAVIINAGNCNGKFMPSQLTIDKVIGNIGRRDGIELRIDAPIKNPATAFKFYHWQGLHRECVIEKEDDYAEFNAFAEGKDATAVMTKIKDDYAQFLGR
ncbi:MAG: ABC-three component system protein, partial [Candidatus Bathyarchaeia archaeon]